MSTRKLYQHSRHSKWHSHNFDVISAIWAQISKHNQLSHFSHWLEFCKDVQFRWLFESFGRFIVQMSQHNACVYTANTVKQFLPTIMQYAVLKPPDSLKYRLHTISSAATSTMADRGLLWSTDIYWFDVKLHILYNCTGTHRWGSGDLLW